MVKEHERVDNLHICGLKIIQNENFFRYGTDAVLLSWMAGNKISDGAKIADLGTGSGIIPILLAGSKNVMVHGLELQENVADMAQRSIKLNGLVDKIKIFEGDIKNPPIEMQKHTYDIVVTNPPYMTGQGGLKNKNIEKTISRHEMFCSLEDVLAAAKGLLKTKGRFFMVHRPQRMVGIFCAMRNNKIEPKRLIMVKPHANKLPNMILIEGIKEAGPGILMEEDIVVYNADGGYTSQILEIYGK
nr:tRNA1(Val) (adenine(37)-N6)-methyltransferase [Alkalibacter mobilis]